MKTFCVSQKRFTQCVGYGLWSLLTVGLSILLFLSINDFRPTEENNFSDSEEWGCEVVPIFLNEVKICYNRNSSLPPMIAHYDYDVIVDNAVWGYKVFSLTAIALFIDVIVIGVWIYSKQTKFKFMWCENRAQQSIGDVKE